ncbi:MAG: hypothetical protein ACOYLV_15710, partial [Rubrivivax sp.]
MTTASNPDRPETETGSARLPGPGPACGHAAPVAGLSPWRLSVAPMMDWTDRHCRYFHRLLTR